jgi:hypothetical protein
MINWKFIFVSTLTYIPFTAFWFFWHNNFLPSVYYVPSVVLSKDTQIIWYMNFANALLLYGMSYFFFRSIKPETKTITAVMWGVYYNISVFGFLNFMAIGFIKEWTWNIVVHDLLFAIISGAGAGWMIFKLNKKL